MKTAAATIPVMPKEHRKYQTLKHDDAYENGWYDALECVEKIPPADVRPVVRGWREEDCAGAAVCSVCGEYAFETSTHHLCGWFPNYCPNCGADIRGVMLN